MTKGASWFLYLIVALGVAAFATSGDNPDAESASGIPFLLGAAAVVFLPGIVVAAIVAGIARLRGAESLAWQNYHRVMWLVLAIMVAFVAIDMCSTVDPPA